MKNKYSSIDANLYWIRVFGEINDDLTAKVKDSVIAELNSIQSPMFKREYEKTCLNLNLAIHAQTEQHIDHEQVISSINYANNLRQKYTSFLNTALSLYLVINDIQDNNQDEFFETYEFHQMQFFTFFAASISYLRLLAIFFEILLADEQDRKEILWKRRWILMSEIFSSVIHSFRMAYLIAKDYQMVLFLNMFIFSIDTFVAVCELIATMYEYQEKIAEALAHLPSLNADEYLQKDYSARIHFLVDQFDQNSLDRVQLLHLMMLEQKYRLDLFRRSANLLLCAFILVAFILLQQYLVINISGVAVSESFMRCIGFLIISVCYNIRDWVLNFCIPSFLSKNTCALKYEGTNIELQNSQVFQKDDPKPQFADILNLKNGIACLSGILFIGVVVSGGPFWAALMVLFIGMLTKELMKKTQHHETERLDISEVFEHQP